MIIKEKMPESTGAVHTHTHTHNTYYRKRKFICKLPIPLKRIYSDYLRPNRDKEYTNFLEMFKKNNYEFICVKDYKKLIDNNDKKYIILRHDIDSDIAIARKIFEIEKLMNIKATYYFRLSTINKEFMKEIVEYGSEVGYHYEELAQYCKKHKQITTNYAKEHIAEIQKEMIKNISNIQAENNLKLYSIASHGDFVNRKINIINKIIYDEVLQSKLGLIEAYDIEQWIDFRTADRMYPICWKEDPMYAIEQGKNKVLVLTHPRWWASAPISRLKLDIQRAIEGLIYK